MKRLLIILPFAFATAFAAEPTLVIPQFLKRQAVPTEDDPLQAKYDEAWEKYEQAVSQATADLTKALDSQFEKAADAGNLELADMWDKKKKTFVDTKTLEWTSDGKAKSEWRKANPKVEFPDDLSEAVTSAQQAFAAAVDALKGDYEALVKEYTKARNLQRAKQVREEMAALDKKPDALPQRPKVAVGKEVAAPKSLAERLKNTAWINENQAKWEWNEDGVLTRNGQPGVKWRPVDERTIYVIFGPDHTDTLIFNEDLTEYRQYYRTLKPEPGMKPVLTGRRLLK